MTIEAKIICDSIGEDSPRLTTFLTRYPKFCHSEHMRHRTGSYCVSSSRAVPVSKNLEEVRSDDLRAGPVYWGAEQKGMQSGEELQGEKLDAAKRIWKATAEHVAMGAEYMVEEGAHKSIVNRLLEPFLHVNVLVTSCEPGLMNFFGLRLDKAAQPEIRALAEAMWAAWGDSTPKLLQPGEWHLPFIDEDDWYEFRPDVTEGGDGHSYDSAVENLCKVSVARCARLSYTSFETERRSTIKENLALYDRLVGAHPIHASPAEHQGTPDKPRLWNKDILGWSEEEPRDLPFWNHPELHGNLPGWIQFRKTLPGEAVAPLPKAYR